MQTSNPATYFWQTNKVRLRPLRIDDAEKKWQEWFDTEARRFLESQLDLPPVSLAEYTKQLEDICEFKDTTRMLSFSIDNLADEFVGWINFFKGNPGHGNFSFGVSIFRQYQRQGYAKDAVHLILKYGYYELRNHKCSSECLAMNEASIKLHQKLGFREEGRRREAVYMDGAYHDIVLFGMLVDEFKSMDGFR
jgi:RimJ/RimL family protein N-acetyltransferase